MQRSEFVRFVNELRDNVMTSSVERPFAPIKAYDSCRLVEGREQMGVRCR